MKLRLLTALTIGAIYIQAHANATPQATAPTNPTAVKTESSNTVPATPHPAQANASKPLAAATKNTTPTAPANNINIPKITVDKEKVSYGIGVDLGENFKAQ